MLTVRFSNRFESLLDSLLDAMAAASPSPFVAEEVIVPSAALRHRVELAAADRFGICANFRFSFLAQWLWRQIGHVVQVAETSPFSTPVLTWRVLGIFRDPAFVAEHPPLAGYLDRADELMRFELAGRAASLLEQYLTYRPDWLARWVDGAPVRIGDGADRALAQNERWQRALWQRIATDLGAGARHPSVAFFEAMKALGGEARSRGGLPATAHVFCPPATPPLYVDMLRQLAQWIDLDLYVLNPCREYWLEIVGPRRLSWLVARGRADHHEVGNRLLAAWGKQTQAHIDLLLQDDGATVLDDAAFRPSPGGTLLARLQNAILDMTELARGSIALAPDDRSIEVHVCHSLTRELEVLQDRLLDLFAGPHPPRPSDILVVTPDLKAAAPLIDAVFGNAPKARAIPHAITGRPASTFNPFARALLAVLAAATSRFQASAVFELLQQPTVARRFAMGSADLDAVHAWIAASGIRWGIDASHRAELDLPAVERHSFRDGLDRLFLGYALPAVAPGPVNGRLGAGDAEGAAALALGRFRDFTRQLERLHHRVARPASPAEWREILFGVVDAFLAPSRDELDDHREVLASIHELHENMAVAGATMRFGADVVRAALQGLLDDPTRGGVPTGSVTFASMSSLRSLPYRIVCAVGLDDRAFPSTSRPAEFDLMAHDPRRGDRQRRLDERNVFLDLVLAARERLYLGYTGRSVRDNSPLPPSVLIAELVEYCAAAIQRPPFSAAALEEARRRLVVEHPLQPFALDSFRVDADPRLRSFHEEYCEAVRQRLHGELTAGERSDRARLDRALDVRPHGDAGAKGADQHRVASGSNGIDDAMGIGDANGTGGANGAGDANGAGAANGDDSPDRDDPAETSRARFFAGPLTEAGPEHREVTLDRLGRFFANPCRYLLRERLGIVLTKGDEELQDDEPFLPDRTARTALAQRLLPRLLMGESPEKLHAFAAAGVEYPPGRLGSLELARELECMTGFARGLAADLAAPALAPVGATLAFDLEGEAWRLSGGFGDLRAGGLRRYRYDDTSALDYLNGWLAHLFLNAVAPAGVEPQTTWHSRNGCYRLAPCDDPRTHLAALLRLYREGLHRPLHFYPKSAWRYMLAGERLPAALTAWRSTRERPYGEENDASYRLALRGVDDPLDAEFEQCAAAVFAPLLNVIDDERLG